MKAKLKTRSNFLLESQFKSTLFSCPETLGFSYKGRVATISVAHDQREIKLTNLVFFIEKPACHLALFFEKISSNSQSFPYVEYSSLISLSPKLFGRSEIDCTYTPQMNIVKVVHPFIIKRETFAAFTD